MRLACGILFTLAFTTLAAAAEPKVEWTAPPTFTFDLAKQSGEVAFALNRLTDVEVAIVDPKTQRVVRHLAAGVLGPNAPAPLTPNALAQRLAWDGHDDFQAPVANPESMAVRVRAGMSVSLAGIAGGNPYIYYLEEVGHNDHSPWGINGLEQKADGMVYVLGHSSNLGPPALRQYDVNGNYVKTLFPAPAGKPVCAMEGWGINIKPDGTYTPQFNQLADPSLTTTLLDRSLGGMARLIPTPDKDRLLVCNTGRGETGFQLLAFNTDGTIASEAGVRDPGPLVNSPAIKLGSVEGGGATTYAMNGPLFTCYSPDGKYFYLSGVHKTTDRYGNVMSIEHQDTWRGGQLWKVDAVTRKAEVFFALDEKQVAEAPRGRNTLIGPGKSYSPLHGVAVDKQENVFVCDRLNRRVVVLDKQGTIVREIPVENPDAIAINHRTGALYLTTRTGEHSSKGKLHFLKYNNWQTDNQPSQHLELSPVGYLGNHKCSHILVCDTEEGSNVWVGFTQLPIQIYRDDAQGLKLLKDFSQVEPSERCVVFDRIVVNPQTEEVYVLDNHSTIWKLESWAPVHFSQVPIDSPSLAMDFSGRYLYANLGRGHKKLGIGRFSLDGQYLPAPPHPSVANQFTPNIYYEWCFTGNGDLGFAVASNGNLVALDQRKNILLFQGDPQQTPWEPKSIYMCDRYPGCVQFDPAGNLYVGYADPSPAKQLPGFERDPMARKMARIHKFAPTGSLASGNLFPTAPDGPTKTYDVPFGAFDTDCILRSPRFSVDGYGRICYPTNIAQRVSLIDNEGNPILEFGTYGNRDSMGGLPGDLVPTPDIPMALPNSVAVTDDYIYIGDMVNHRLLKVQKEFALAGQSN